MPVQRGWGPEGPEQSQSQRRPWVNVPVRAVTGTAGIYPQGRPRRAASEAGEAWPGPPLCSLAQLTSRLPS